jgi:tetratricopeptide (TPR) repeat protein
LKKIFIVFFLFFFQKSNVLFAQSKSIDSLKKVLTTIKVDTTRVNTYNVLADAYKNIDPDSTTLYSQKAMALATKTKYDFGIANAYLNKGNANVVMSNYKLALLDFRNSQIIFKSLIDKDSDINSSKIKNGLARSYNNSGVVYAEINDYLNALDNYQKALKIYEKIGLKKNISIGYNNIGSIYRSLNDNKKALHYFLKSLKIQEQIKEPTIAVTLTNIGFSFSKMNKNSEALYYYKKAEMFFGKTENSRGYALLNNYLGEYYEQINNYDQAIAYYNKSLKISESIGNLFQVSLTLNNIGQLYLDQNKYNEAINFAHKSLEMAKELGALEQTIIAEKLLSEIYEATNNPKKSLEYYKSYIIGHDSLYNDENKRKILRSEINFEFEKKEALLKETNKRKQQFILFTVLGCALVLGLLFLGYNRFQIKRRLTLQNEIIAYEQKALHLQMNPHFIFNCLGSISSFIVQNGTDSAIKYLSKFSKLMRLTLEYSRGSLIPVDKEVESLQNYLELEQLRFNKKFEFLITSSGLIEDDMALPPLLIQPFVENAILHGMVSKEVGGKIEVNFDLKNNQLVCTVADNGIGIKKSKALKKDSVKAHKSMALEITSKRLQMIGQNAKVVIEEILDSSQVVIGTKVILYLPLQYTSETKIRI